MSIDLKLDVRRTRAGIYQVTFAYLKAPLDVREAAFGVHGLHMVSPAELGFLRATQPEGVTTFSQPSTTNTDIWYDDRDQCHDRDQCQVVVVPDGAISKYVGIANLVQAHARGTECIVNDNHQKDVVYAMVDRMLEDGNAFTVNHDTTKIQTSEFSGDDLTFRLFSDARLGIQAHMYGDWLKQNGQTVQYFVVDSVSETDAEGHSMTRTRNGPYLNRMCVMGEECSRFLVGSSYRTLHYRNGAFGVRFERIAESSTTE